MSSFRQVKYHFSQIQSISRIKVYALPSLSICPAPARHPPLSLSRLNPSSLLRPRLRRLRKHIQHTLLIPLSSPEDSSARTSLGGAGCIFSVVKFLSFGSLARSSASVGVMVSSSILTLAPHAMVALKRVCFSTMASSVSLKSGASLQMRSCCGSERRHSASTTAKVKAEKWGKSGLWSAGRK